MRVSTNFSVSDYFDKVSRRDLICCVNFFINFMINVVFIDSYHVLGTFIIVCYRLRVSKIASILS